ncbi:MAG: helical backbone metal receptor [Ignavibacteriota bacterium]
MRKLFIFVLLLGLYSCTNKTVKDEINLKDDLGKSFVFKEVPKRVISLAPSITESIYFIQADTNLVGVTKYCDYPLQAKNKTVVGGMLDPNFEIITKLNPDLIFLTIEGNSQVTYKSLIDLGYRVFVLNPRSIDGVVTALETLNRIFKTPKGEEIINSFRTEVNKYIQTKPSKSYAGFLSLKPLISYNGTTFLSDVFSKSGYENIYKDEKLDYPSIMEEDIFVKDPEYLFVFADSTADSRKLVKDEVESKFGKLKSVLGRKYFILDESIFTRPGPRILNSLKILSSI